jgi:hypothetical protein
VGEGIGADVEAVALGVATEQAAGKEFTVPPDPAVKARRFPDRETQALVAGNSFKQK